MTGFQTVVNTQPAPAIEGDWCSANPKFSMVSGDGGLVAGPAGAIVGRFMWADPNGVVNFGGVGRIGFVQKDQLSVIPFTLTGGIPQSTMAVPAGYEMNLISSGPVWIRFAAGATPGNKVYANFADGTAVSLATASPSGTTSTSFTIAAESFTVTASIAAGVMTVSPTGITGTLYPGAIISGSGSISGNSIYQQLSGTTGGAGTYQLAYDDGTVVSSETITGTYGLFTPGGTITGTFSLGDTLTGSVTAGSVITANASNGASLTGTGGAGTYVVNLTQSSSSGTVTAATNVETPWYVDSYAGNAELAMCTREG